MPQKGHSITTRVSKNIIFARLILGDMLLTRFAAALAAAF
jgi:hypothetical protein